MFRSPNNDPYAHLRYLKMKQVSELTGYTPQHIYRLERAGKFPARVRIGENRVGWKLETLEKWFAERPIVVPPDQEDDDNLSP
ncbi:MAG: AlpA family phage regulatory protein [Hyphomicrobiales bacterium]|nr:AlpA family phage regulatory protein [Hyphomicrobiales bacterium]